MAESGSDERALVPDLPRFARTFPPNPEVQAIVRAFADGRHAEVRSRARALRQSSNDDRVREAASELLKRLEPDPVAALLLILTALLLLTLTIYWTLYGGKSPIRPTPPVFEKVSLSGLPASAPRPSCPPSPRA